MQCSILQQILFGTRHECNYFWFHQVSDKRPLSSLNDENHKQTGQPGCVNNESRGQLNRY